MSKTTSGASNATPPESAPTPPAPSGKIALSVWLGEQPRLKAVTRDVLTAIHREDKRTREQWAELAQNYRGTEQ